MNTTPFISRAVTAYRRRGQNNRAAKLAREATTVVVSLVVSEDYIDQSSVTAVIFNINTPPIFLGCIAADGRVGNA